jgi:cytochrome c biogenesis protein CcdA
VGGEFLLVLLLIGTGLGVAAAIIAARRTHARDWRKSAIVVISFFAGLATPIVLFVAFGTTVRIASSQPRVSSLFERTAAICDACRLTTRSTGPAGAGVDRGERWWRRAG